MPDEYLCHWFFVQMSTGLAHPQLAMHVFWVSNIHEDSGFAAKTGIRAGVWRVDIPPLCEYVEMSSAPDSMQWGQRQVSHRNLLQVPYSSDMPIEHSLPTWAEDGAESLALMGNVL